MGEIGYLFYEILSNIVPHPYIRFRQGIGSIFRKLRLQLHKSLDFPIFQLNISGILQEKANFWIVFLLLYLTALYELRRFGVNVSMDWQKGLKFSGRSAFGHEISTDGSKQAGGQEDGYKPPELLLFGLAGCTGIDVVVIAEKMSQEITGLKINVSADQREEFPKAFNKIHLEYIVTGKNIDPDKLENIITLSEEKYCSVGSTLNGVARITHSYKIVEE
jgi:putative redox protein